MVPDHTIGGTAQQMFRLHVVCMRYDQFIGTGYFDVVNEPNIHIAWIGRIGAAVYTKQAVLQWLFGPVQGSH